jgi:bacillithiol biosynthesis cysteine-adding enzyme BshC
MTTLDFRRILDHGAGYSNIFLDYLYNFAKLKRFFNYDFHLLPEIPDLTRGFQKSPDHRQRVAEILEAQNLRFDCPQKTIENIHALREADTFCVVTGQQVGIVGGPLYTFYKAVTAVKLAARLSKALAPMQFVPVFWLEGEDHDLEEVNNITLLSHENKPVKTEYTIDGKPHERNLGAVGDLVFDMSLELFFQAVEKTLPSSEFRSQVTEAVRSAYIPGRTFSEAFACWINRLLAGTDADGTGDPGLIFISSNDKRIKQILSPVFLKELERFPLTSQLMIAQSAELEAEYHAQIKPKAINLFLFHKGGRYLIEPRESDFSLKGTRFFITREELLRTAVEMPESLSPNVVLRPICQDTLLPTAVYVAGPSEVAYFAQLKPVYEAFSVAMPVIYPRASATVLEKKLQLLIEKYELTLDQIFGARKQVNEHVMGYLSEVELEGLFASSRETIDEVLNEMKFGLSYVDPTLLGVLETARTKIAGHIGTMEEKTAAAQQRKHEIALRQIDKVFNTIFPNGNYQERELNILHFVNKHGLDFPRRLADQIQIDALGHQVIEL